MSSFDKFTRKEKGSKLKEQIRQEKKKARQETKEYFNKKKAEGKRQYSPSSDRSNNTSESGPGRGKTQASAGNRSYSSGKNFRSGKSAHSKAGRYKGKPNDERPDQAASYKSGKSFGAKPRGYASGNTVNAKAEKITGRNADKRSGDKADNRDASKTANKFSKPNSGSTPGEKRLTVSKASPKHNDSRRDTKSKISGADKEIKRSSFSKAESPDNGRKRASVVITSRKESGATGGVTKASKGDSSATRNLTNSSKGDSGAKSKPVSQAGSLEKAPTPDLSGAMPLNKFVAHAGVCSRRDAVGLVKSGKVSVNGEVITEPGHKVGRNDEIRIQGKKITTSKNLVYILLNKPKDHITTTEDPEGRKTVMDIVKNATSERVYPVGRLDRNTTGVLLLTNDGELAQKLSHPSYEVRKIYEVTLDKPLTKKDFDELMAGVTLEDGFIAPDSLAYADSRDKSIIGIEIHSGKNRIVRRMFEKIGYDVRNLDRVMYANLTKKNVERGKFRFLMEKEVRLLKFMNASYGKKKG